MDDVTGRAVKLLLDLVERLGLEVAPLLTALPYSPAALRSGKGAYPWDLWVELLDRIEARYGSDTIERLGTVVSEVQIPHEFKRVAQLFWSAKRLYHLNSRWGASADFRSMRSECEDLGDGRLRVTNSIPAHLRGSTAPFRMIAGLLRSLPRLIDEPLAHVHAEVGPHSGTYIITLPPPATLKARVRRGFAAFSGLRTATEQLGAQQQEILEQNRLLSEQLREQRRVEHALRESEARWRTLAENLRKSEEQLRQAQKMEAIGRLAGGVAHDFNNLLSVVLGYAALLLRRLPHDGRDAADVREIQHAGERAAALTRQLLAFSRQAVLAPTITDLNVVVTRCERMLARLIGEDIDLRLQLCEQLDMVTIDQGQMEQVILNLVVNARDAMPQGGTVTLETSNVYLDELYVASHPDVKPGPHVMVSVSDTGVGIPAEHHALVFEPFFTTKEKGAGTGLGLSMVRGIVQQSGGSVWLYSELGLGTTLKIYLPVAQPQDASHVAATSTPRAATGTETILLVEDEAQVRAVASKILGGVGYHVLVAASPAEALAIFARRTAPIDLLLTDVVMPRMSGRVLAEQLATQQHGLKVLYMSGYAEATIAHRGVVEPGVALLQKPFSIESLTRHVRDVLDAIGPA